MTSPPPAAYFWKIEIITAGGQWGHVSLKYSHYKLSKKKEIFLWFKCTSVHIEQLLEIRSKTETQLKFRHKLTKAVSSTSSLNKIILTQNAKNRKIHETWITRNRLMIVKSILTKKMFSWVQLSQWSWFMKQNIVSKLFHYTFVLYDHCIIRSSYVIVHRRVGFGKKT